MKTIIRMGNQNPEEKTSMYTERREDTDTVPAQKMLTIPNPYFIVMI